MASFESNEKTVKEKTVKEKTFLSWNVCDSIGYKTEGEMVNYVWCKVCAENKEAFKSHPNIRGATKTSSINAFTDGTNVVTKFQVSFSVIQFKLRLISFFK